MSTPSPHRDFQSDHQKLNLSLTVSCPQNILEIGQCAIQCEHDSDCKDLQKCCKNGCGGTQCVRGKQRMQKPNCAICMINVCHFLFQDGSGLCCIYVY